MKLKRTKPVDSSTERLILIGCIVSDEVCYSLHDLYHRSYFQTAMTKEVSIWCREYYDKYECAPKQDIQSIFESKSKAGLIEPSLEEQIEGFLESISEEYQDMNDFNGKYYKDELKKYFKKRSYAVFGSRILEAAEKGDIEAADKIYSNFIKVQDQQDNTRDIAEDDGLEKFKQSLASKKPYLFRLPGRLGELFGDIERSTLIGLLGREKVGKSYVLQIFAEAGAKAGLNVLFIQAGDLTQDDLDMRLACSRTKMVYGEEQTGDYIAPVMDCLKNQLGKCDKHPSEPIVTKDHKNKLTFIVDVEEEYVLEAHDPCIECYKDRFKRHKFRGSIWWEKKVATQWYWGILKKKLKLFKKWFKGTIKTQAFSMKTLKMSDIYNWIMVNSKTTGWVPDLILIDYPDIMDDEISGTEYRHGENQKWMVARRISQDFHACVALVTQADSKAFSKKGNLKLENFSEDKRKYSHVTHFYGINRSETEEIAQCFRISPMILRKDKLQTSKQVTVLQDLKISKPYVGSFFGKIPEMISGKKKN